MDPAFETATAVEGLGGGRYSAHVHEGWDIGGNANGGYLLAIAGRAMAAEVGRPPLTITAHYLRPAPSGDGEVDVQVIRSGRRLATATATFLLAGAPTLQLLGTFGDQQPTGEVLAAEGPVDLPPYAECVPSSPSTEGEAGSFHDRVATRLRPGDEGFRAGRPTGTAELTGWFAFHREEPVDAFGLLLAADAFPPPIFNTSAPVGWVPTVELTVHLRGDPAPGPLRCRFHSRFIHGGLTDEEGEIWDSAGTLVLQSRQLALVPRG